MAVGLLGEDSEPFPEGKKLRLEELIQRELPVFAARTGWEMTARVAILLQCLDSQVNGGPGPLGVLAAGERVAQIEVVQLPPEAVSAADANDWLDELMCLYGPGTIIVATPIVAPFPVFDGFVYFKESNCEVRKAGYQVQLGRACPTQPVPDFLDQGVLLRGSPPSQAATSAPAGPGGRWRYFTAKEIDTLLGASLQPLKPSAWPEHPAQDEVA